MPIAENETLFNLIGTTYGGDGQETFALPDLRGRIPIHQGNNQGESYTVGQQAGTETSTLHGAANAATQPGVVLASASPGFLASPAGSTFAAHRDHKAFTQGAPPPVRWHLLPCLRRVALSRTRTCRRSCV